MASPTLIAFSETDSGATAVGAPGETSASFTWQTGDVLVALAFTAGTGAGHTFTTPTNTGSGLTWVQQQVHASSSDCAGAAFTAVATANSSGTVTVTASLSGGTDRVSQGVHQWRAPSGSIAVGNSKLQTGATTSPQQAALTMSSADSSVCWGAGDWSAGAVETPSPTSTAHSSASPGPSALPVATPVAGQYTFYYDVLDDEPSTGSINFGFTGSSAGPFTILAVEVKLTAPAASAAPQRAFLPLMAPQGLVGL